MSQRFETTVLLAAITLLPACGGLLGTFPGEAVLDGKSRQTMVLDAAVAGDSAEGSFSATSTQTQMLSGHGASAAGALLLPPGAIDRELTVQIGPSASILAAGELSELSISDADVSAEGQAIAFLPADPGIKLLAPMSIQLPHLTAAGLLETGFLAVLSLTIDPESGGTIAALIPGKELRIDGNRVTFESWRFGIFQTVRTKSEFIETKSNASGRTIPKPSFITKRGKKEQATSEPSEASQDDDSTSENSETPTEPPAKPSLLELTDVRNPDATYAPTFRWTTVPGATGYQYAMGSSAGASDVVSWQDTPTPTANSEDLEARVSVSALTEVHNGSLLYVSVRAVSEGVAGDHAFATDGFQLLVCPDGFIRIHGDTTSGLGGSVYTEGTKTTYSWTNGHDTSRDIADFCVMKYEASQDASTHAAVSVPNGTVWVNLPRGRSENQNNTAKDECGNLGTGYQLMGNHHWQTIARQAIAEESNWGVTTADYPTMSRGNSEGAGLLPTGPSDDKGCTGITQSYVATHLASTPSSAECTWHFHRRTLNLLGGAVIWDFAGNAAEWIADDAPLPDQTAANSGNVPILELSDEDRLVFGADDLSKANQDNAPWLAWGKVNGIEHRPNGGQRYEVIRGGHWGAAGNVGVLGSRYASADLGKVGFRCVYVP